MSAGIPEWRLRPPSQQQTLFDVEPGWREEWWGMPSFSQRDARPQYKITINFMTAEDVRAFSVATGIPVTTSSDSAWFPFRDQSMRAQYYFDGPKTGTRYPVCIPSKGRADCQTTGAVLDRLGVAYKFFVEETEYEAYCTVLGAANVVRLPFHDLGQGSIPARNFIWEWARERGHKRHWTVDDNIRSFLRMHENKQIPVRGGGFFRAMEDFVDRYENVAIAGPHHKGFISTCDPNLTPLLWNTRVYSCILLDTTLPHRWRGKFNEDTDLSLRLLKEGYCSALFRALMMNKNHGYTAFSAGKAMKGGNTDTVYSGGDFRRAFAESLRDQHPDCVKVSWKFNRWHHEVDYSAFRNNIPRLRPGITMIPVDNNYGMELVRQSDSNNQPSEEE